MPRSGTAFWSCALAAGVLLVCAPVAVFGQATDAKKPAAAKVSVPAASGSAAAPAKAAASVSAEPKPLPTTYRGFSLGMSLEDTKKALASDDLFTFRGDRDVSLLPKSDQVLIETTGLSFIRRAFFQFRDGKLFIMAFTLDPDKVDHYSVFTALTADYGDPAALSPKEAVWVSDAIRLSIERPLTVKYIDKVVFDQLARDSSVKKSKEFVLREEFLNGF